MKKYIKFRPNNSENTKIKNLTLEHTILNISILEVITKQFSNDAKTSR